MRCWFVPEEMKAGPQVHEQIDEAIRLHDRLLLILSEDSMKSEWVRTEIAEARKLEMKDGKRVLFPVRLVPFDVLRVGVVRRRYRQGFGARNTRVLHPRLQQLEGARFVSDGVSAAGDGFDSESHQVTARVA